MGFGVGIEFGAIETEAHHEDEDAFHTNLWEWGSTHALAMDHPRVADTLTAEGVVPEVEVATTTLDMENIPTSVVPIEEDTL